MQSNLITAEYAETAELKGMNRINDNPTSFASISIIQNWTELLKNRKRD